MSGRPERLADFSEFVVARQRHLLRTAYLLSGDWHDAQDLVQTALANLCRAWDRAKHADSIDDYAHRVLINAYLSRRRKLGRERRLLDAADRLPPTPSAATPDHAALRVALFAALDELPKQTRAILVLRYWHDLSVEATADAVRCSPGTVKSQTSRALARLRVTFGDSLSDYERAG